jgi:hypothetical protein
MSEPTLQDLLTAVQAVPAIEPNTREDGEGTEHDIVHQLELDAIAALLGFADEAEDTLASLDERVGELEDNPGGGPGAILRTLTVGFDGGSVDGTPQSVRTGQVFELRLPWAIELQRWTLLPQGGASGDITLAVRTRPFASGSYTSITASAPPASTGGARADSSTLTGWTTALAAGDLLQVEITARTGLVPGVTLILEGTQA